MQRIMTASIVMVLLVATVAGCASSSLEVGEAVASGVPAQGDPAGSMDPRLASAIADFGFDLLAHSGGEQTHGSNTVISPLSVHAALAMALNGAAGDTADEMENALGLTALGTDEANTAYANLLASLDAIGQSGPTTLDIENSLWVDEGYALRDEFAQADRNFFGAQLETLDLQADGPQRINEWVAQRTNDRITDLLDESPSSAVLYLVNAVYLKGEWETPFGSEATTDAPFSVGTDRIDVPTLNRGGTMLYAERDGTRAVRLPYRDGRLGMWIVLPPQVNGDPSGAVDLELERMDAAAWAELTSAATSRPGRLALPKYTTRTKTELQEPLKTMGMASAFAETADFSGIHSGDEALWISRVLHQTFVSVDEAGTEAAAATGVEFLATGALPMPPSDPFEMIADRPFLFAIDDSATGAILFLGRIEDPR